MTDKQYKDIAKRIHEDLTLAIGFYMADMGDPWLNSPEDYRKKKHIRDNLNTFLSQIRNVAEV